jgi:hypothetical protein
VWHEVRSDITPTSVVQIGDVGEAGGTGARTPLAGQRSDSGVGWSVHPRRVEGILVSKLLAFVGAMGGGYAGWALGAPAGPFAAYVLSVVGTGAGLYWGRRLGRHYEG